MVNKTVDVGVGAAIHQPFNSYAANMTWTSVPHMKNVVGLSVFGMVVALATLNNNNVLVAINTLAFIFIERISLLIL